MMRQGDDAGKCALEQPDPHPEPFLSPPDRAHFFGVARHTHKFHPLLQQHARRCALQQQVMDDACRHRSRVAKRARDRLVDE